MVSKSANKRDCPGRSERVFKPAWDRNSGPHSPAGTLNLWPPTLGLARLQYLRRRLAWYLLGIVNRGVQPGTPAQSFARTGPTTMADPWLNLDGKGARRARVVRKPGAPTRLQLPRGGHAPRHRWWARATPRTGRRWTG